MKALILLGIISFNAYSLGGTSLGNTYFDDNNKKHPIQNDGDGRFYIEDGEKVRIDGLIESLPNVIWDGASGQYKLITGSGGGIYHDGATNIQTQVGAIGKLNGTGKSLKQSKITVLPSPKLATTKQLSASNKSLATHGPSFHLVMPGQGFQHPGSQRYASAGVSLTYSPGKIK